MSFISDFFPASRAKPKRNYIKENIKRLQEINKVKQDNIYSAKPNQILHRYQHALSEINDTIGPGYRIKRDNSNLSLNPANLKNTVLKELTHPAGFRHQSCQTIAEKDLDSLYHEGVIRFPSRSAGSVEHKHTKMVRTISLQTETPPTPRSVSPTISGSPAGDSIKDFVKMNAMVQISPLKKRQQTVIDPIRPPPHYQMGMLPKYLREQKKEQEKIKEISSSMDPDCPPGHTILPEEERVKHLAELKQRYTDLVCQLNAIPVRTDTLRTRKKRMEIEKELQKAEAGIRLFSRDKLFIQVTS